VSHSSQRHDADAEEKAEHSMPHEIRVAIAGVGNCASTLVQGVSYYRKNPREAAGLIHHDVAGLKVGDIHFACAFDVDSRKIGRRLKDAVFAAPNNSQVFFRKPEDDGAKVFAGPVADGVAAHLVKFDKARRTDVASKAATASRQSVVKALKQTGATILVNYLPVGSQKGTELYAHACLEAGVAMVNCIPVFIASEDSGIWARRFSDAGLPIVGDDVKSQFGATITHRVLMKLAQSRGMKIDASYQLNVGGNMDFLNMLERGRLKSKKRSKTEAVTSQVPMEDENIHIGPSDYIPFLTDKKVCYVRMNMRGFANLPMELDMKLMVEDSPNSAGVVVDAVRCLALARREKIAGPLHEVCAALMKRPPQQMTDEEAAAAMDAWIERAG
jgi:myo-inositol-1-phosphate synthase